MKKYLFILMAALVMVSCSKKEQITDPNMTVINSTQYDAIIYFDNAPVLMFGAYANGCVYLRPYYGSPIHVVAEFYDGRKLIAKRYWQDYIFSRDKNYKMTLTTNTSTITTY